MAFHFPPITEIVISAGQLNLDFIKLPSSTNLGTSINIDIFRAVNIDVIYLVMSNLNPRVTTFNADFIPAFVELNKEWIETYFVLEPTDLHQLSNPQGSILEAGGEIFFVFEDGVAVGTCAMIPHGPNSYELAKMAVAPRVRGKGYGDLLMTTAIQWARSQGAKEVSLLSNTVLEPAITLYKKHGFITVHLGEHPDYERCNIEMKLPLS